MQKITEGLLNDTLKNASESKRQRINHNFHPTLEANYQRMLNCLLPETYCQPHRHFNPPKSESFIILKGKAVVLEFDDNGIVTDYILLDSSKGKYGVDIFPGTWHTIIALTPCVVFESKDGPYVPLTDKDFATWAPMEGSPNAQKYNKELLLKIGM
jgi:cupin fold WbuC family metalloprotein